MEEREVEDVFVFIRRKVLDGSGGGPVSRGELVYHFGHSAMERVQAAIAVLLLERPPLIAAYQRGEDWVYTLADFSRGSQRGVTDAQLRIAVRQTNPWLADECDRDSSGETWDALRHYAARRPPQLGLGRSNRPGVPALDDAAIRSAARASNGEGYYEWEALDIETHRSGGVRVIRAR